MALSRVEKRLKMMNDIAKCKPSKQAKQFKIEVLTDQINNPEKWEIFPEEIQTLRAELEKVKQEA